MKKSINTLRAQTEQRLRRKGAAAALFVILGSAVSMGAITESLPAAHGDARISGFLGGFLFGLLIVALIYTARKIIELRRALSSDLELKRLYARENDELARHQRSEIGRLFSEAFLPLLVTSIVVAGMLSFEAMIGIAAVTVALAITYAGISLYVKGSLPCRE